MSTGLDSRGNSPLMRACRHKCEQQALELLACGADVFATNKDGETALFLASDAGLDGVVTALLHAGADPCVTNRYGVTAMHVARTPKICASLYLAGGSVDAQDVNKCAPLHWAARRGLAMVMQSLVSMGANINVFDARGNTPLHLASSAAAVDAARDAFANENLRNLNGLSAKEQAAGRGQKYLHNVAPDRPALKFSV